MRVAVVYCDEDLENTLSKEDCEGRNDDIQIQDVMDAIAALGHEIVRFPAERSIIPRLQEDTRIDVIFNVADEGFRSNPQMEPHLPAFFEMLGLKFTGSDYMCLGTCLNKARTKQILIANGLPTPRFWNFEEKISEGVDLHGLQFPMIVKPSREDGSIGIRRDSVVEDVAALVRKVNEVIDEYDQPALVEEFIDGREVNVGILGTRKPFALPASEIIFNLPSNERNFLSYETKWHAGSVYYTGTVPHCPADLTPALKEELVALALKAYRLMGVRGFGRVDFRIRNNKPFILEVNPNPDISRDAGLARMARAAGLSYEQLIGKILDIALGNE